MVEQQYRCEQCGAGFATPIDVQRHAESEHGGDVQPAPSTADGELSVDELLDVESEDSFPASDPPSTTPVQGVGAPAQPGRRLNLDQ